MKRRDAVAFGHPSLGLSMPKNAPPVESRQPDRLDVDPLLRRQPAGTATEPSPIGHVGHDEATVADAHLADRAPGASKWVTGAWQLGTRAEMRSCGDFDGHEDEGRAALRPRSLWPSCVRAPHRGSGAAEQDRAVVAFGPCAWPTRLSAGPGGLCINRAPVPARCGSPLELRPARSRGFEQSRMWPATVVRGGACFWQRRRTAPRCRHAAAHTRRAGAMCHDAADPLQPYARRARSSGRPSG